MLESSAKKFRSIEVGSCVTVAVPKVDRGPLDKQYLLGQVVEDGNDVYRIATESGVLKKLVTTKSDTTLQITTPLHKSN